MSPIDFVCHDCGESFELGVDSLESDDYRPDCPACESESVATDWDAVVARFGEPRHGGAGKHALSVVSED